MNLYNDLPDAIDLHVVKHIPLEVLPKHGMKIASMMATLLPYVKEHEEIYSTLKEHINYIQQPDNRIPGYKKPGGLQLLEAVTQYLSNNLAEINKVVNLAFGDNRYVSKSDLTVQQLAILDLLIAITGYVITIIDVTGRVMNLLLPVNISNPDKHLMKVYTCIKSTNARREKIRQILLMDDNIKQLLNAPSTPVIPSMVDNQFEDLTGWRGAYYPIYNYMRLFQYTPGVVKPYKDQHINGYLKGGSQFIATYPHYVNAMKNNEVKLKNNIEKALAGALSDINHTLRKLGRLKTFEP